MANKDVTLMDVSKGVVVEALEAVGCAAKAVHNLAKAAEQGTALLVDLSVVSRAYVLSQAKPETIALLKSDSGSQELLDMFGVK